MSISSAFAAVVVCLDLALIFGSLPTAPPAGHRIRAAGSATGDQRALRTAGS